MISNGSMLWCSLNAKPLPLGTSTLTRGFIFISCTAFMLMLLFSIKHDVFNILPLSSFQFNCMRLKIGVGACETVLLVQNGAMKLLLQGLWVAKSEQARRWHHSLQPAYFTDVVFHLRTFLHTVQYLCLLGTGFGSIPGLIGRMWSMIDGYDWRSLIQIPLEFLRSVEQIFLEASITA